MKSIIETTFNVFLILETIIFNFLPDSLDGTGCFCMIKIDFVKVFVYLKDSMICKQVNSHKEDVDMEDIFQKYINQRRNVLS